jgi:hypothetical protein
MSRSGFGPVLATLAILIVPAAFSADASPTGSRAERAMGRYVTACLSHDETTLRAVTTPDVLIEIETRDLLAEEGFELKRVMATGSSTETSILEAVAV